jgi:hypothetical protein
MWDAGCAAAIARLGVVQWNGMTIAQRQLNCGVGIPAPAPAPRPRGALPPARGPPGGEAAGGRSRRRKGKKTRKTRKTRRHTMRGGIPPPGGEPAGLVIRIPRPPPVIRVDSGAQAPRA